jgi:hypothetical protein
LLSSLSSVIRESFFNLVSARILLLNPYRHRSWLPCHLLSTFGFGTSTAFAFKLDGIIVSLSDTRSSSQCQCKCQCQCWRYQLSHFERGYNQAIKILPSNSPSS